MPTRRASTAGGSAPSGEIIFATVFGLFLGLALLKFGNPIILNAEIQRTAPKSAFELWTYAWPPLWAVWGFIPLVIAGIALLVIHKPRWPAKRWLTILPFAWLAWQLVSATRSVDRQLTMLTLLQFAGCVVSYFIGALLIRSERALQFLMFGVIAAFAFCLVRAVNQRVYEFPSERAALLEGQRTGWTNFDAQVLAQMREDKSLIRTNGVEVVNPKLLEKYEKGRVYGTLVYPNALAGAILLIGPTAIAIAWLATQRFRRVTGLAVMAVTVFLCGAALFWTGSKSGWLVALLLVGLRLFGLRWPAKWKWTALAVALVGGLVLFAARFHGYFAAGAKSAGARIDYWRVAVRVVSEHPMVGSGPGTFQRPHAVLMQPEAEMARLVHNDYLEQFSDSGIPGGVLYLTWIAGIAWAAWRSSSATTGAANSWIKASVGLGLIGWFAQGMSEFALYIPALAWTAFALGGALLNSHLETVRQTSPRAGNVRAG